MRAQAYVLVRFAMGASVTLVLAACAPQPAPAPPENASTPSGAPVADLPATASVSVPVPSSSATTSHDAATTAEVSPDGGHREAGVDSVGEALALQARLLVVDAVVGTGREAKDGDHVTVHCVGTLADGTVFESSRARKRPVQFVVGGDKVVMGLSEGVAGMRVGGRRTLTVPPALGYGSRGSGTKVPPGATLAFDVELLSVK